MIVIKNFEMREYNYGCGVVTQNFLLNYCLFKIIAKPSRKVQFNGKTKIYVRRGYLLRTMAIKFANRLVNFCLRMGLSVDELPITLIQASVDVNEKSIGCSPELFLEF